MLKQAESSASLLPILISVPWLHISVLINKKLVWKTVSNRGLTNLLAIDIKNPNC